MQVFEFHFNPRLRPASGSQAKLPDLIFDTFCFEPENIYEKRAGSLYMAGVLKNVLPQNIRFLDNLARVVKERYYTPTLHSPEKSLKESLKSANDFLERIVKGGNVSWLGNLFFAALSLRNFELNFTKVGDLKIYLLRGGQTIDIDKKLKLEGIEPYPLKIFGNIVSGRLAENDIILVLTKEVSDCFQSQNLISEIAKLTPFDEKGLREILEKKREELLKVSGICLLIFLSKEILAKKRETILPRPKEFSLKDVFSQVVNPLKKIIGKFRLPLFKFPKLKTPKPRFPKLSKNVILILFLIFCLALGFFFSQKEKKEQLKEFKAGLEKIQEKVDLAESFLILKESRPQVIQDADKLLKESWEELYPLTKIAHSLPRNLSGQVFSLEDIISENLEQINKLVEISEPEKFFEFNPREFVPQKLLFDGKDLYSFSPYSQNLFKIDEEGKGEIIQSEKKFNLAADSDGSLLFFAKPDQLTILNNGSPASVILEEPYSDFNFDALSSYQSNLYFFDKKTGEIIKYPFLGDLKWGSPRLWLAQKAIDGESTAVDGSLWILDKDNSINKYYAGVLQEKLKTDIFPEIKDLSKIFTSPALPYLYVSEHCQNRIIILNKSGRLIKQFRSEKFDNLLDFVVSPDGKEIYLLNGLKVYLLTNLK